MKRHLEVVGEGFVPSPPARPPENLSQIKARIAVSTLARVPGLELALGVARAAIDTGHGEREALVLLTSVLTPESPQDSRGE